MNSVRKGTKDETKLADKLSELEQKMKQLQESLMDEKLKLNRDRGDEGDLPENWATMNRLHLPQCPMAKVVYSAITRPACPVHGHAPRPGMNTRSLPHLPAKQETRPSDDSDRYSKLIDEAEKYSRLDNINEKFRELYESSMFSPTFYRPRAAAHGLASVEKDLEKRLVRFAQTSSGDDSSSREYTVNNNKSYDSFEELSITRNSSTGNSRSERCSDLTSSKETFRHFEEDSSTDPFNPFDAIESVRNKFLDIENFINEASTKTRLKETT